MLPTLLGLLLLIALPAEALWRTRRDQSRRNRIARYKATILLAVALLGVLLIVAYIEDLPAAALGLDINLGTTGVIGLGIAVVVCLGLSLAIVMTKSIKQGAPSSDNDNLMPEGRREIGYFIGMVLVIGFAWEVLYRGFLLWWLAPLVGVAGAVVLSGVSYGLAHGWKDNRKGLGSIVSALLFATAYALTGSLWWLILIHTALPIIVLFAMRKQADYHTEGAPPKSRVPGAG